MAAEVDEGVGGVARFACLIPLGGFSPGGLADAPLALAAAAAVRMVHRIHCHTPRLLRQIKQIRLPQSQKQSNRRAQNGGTQALRLLISELQAGS